jgi:hypothetical protein
VKAQRIRRAAIGAAAIVAVTLGTVGLMPGVAQALPQECTNWSYLMVYNSAQATLAHANAMHYENIGWIQGYESAMALHHQYDENANYFLGLLEANC